MSNTCPTGVSLSPKVRNFVDHEAQRLGVSTSAYLRAIIEREVARLSKPTTPPSDQEI